MALDNSQTHRFCLAPMMDLSDRHCRYLWRLITKKARLYSEMVTTGALIHGNKEQFLEFNTVEHPIALQLGGSQSSELATCAKMAEEHGFDEVNLNCGCPSDRVSQGMIGACLMAHPQLVADGIKAMQDAVNIPITVKHRIGIDDKDSLNELIHFVGTIADTGCHTFIVHARKAWLNGLSPKQNREIPPLVYSQVYALKQAFPHLNIVINGGIKDLQECEIHLSSTNGVMIGREAYSNPAMLIEVDKTLFDDHSNVVSQEEIMLGYIDYCEQELKRGSRLHHMSKHVLGLFQGQRGARAFRRYISENAYHPDADHTVLINALEKVK